MRRLALLFLIATPLAAATMRLPQTVIPEHYDIRITPDLASETFHGSETIEVIVKEPTDRVTLHAVGLEIEPKVDVDKENETVTLHFPHEVPAGPMALHFTFNGKLGKQLRGLYLSTTDKRKYAVTQFEATSARYAFPSFDEPAMKATFDITLVVDNGDTAISNGAIVSDTPAGAGKHAIKFATTRKMSTYLVAMLVGDFQCISGGADGTPIRVCTTPGLQPLGHFALSAAEASIHFFDGYYGIQYPFGKLDLIGIPDFAAGAMENAGAITFRETDLLVDDKTASELAKKRVAEVVAHEIAHQWFGDLVTMKWWNDIWLNEGFATFMSQKPIEAWKPEWRSDLDKAMATDEALNVDSTLSTSPIRGPESAEAGFSNAGIIYGKTASVLRMVEEWIGPDVFRDAIRTYLKKYAWSNAAAEDFWSTMKESSRQPTDAVLQSFIDLTGAPLLHVTDSCSANERTVTIAQDRLLPRSADVSSARKTETWTIPLCPAGGAPCRLVTKSPETVTLASPCDKPLFLSRNGAGYFVVDYPAADRMQLRDHLREFNDRERIAYNGNEWLLVRMMRRDVEDYLQLLRAMPRPAERPLVTAIADNLVWLGQRLVDDHNRAAWQAFVHEALRGYAPATWETPAGETSEQRIARAAVLWALGYSAADPQVIAGAKTTAEAYMKDPASVDAVIADRALKLSAVYGDEAFFDRVVAHIAAAPSPELAKRYRDLLPLFRDPKVIARAVDYIYSDQVRTQDVGIVAGAMFTDPVTRPYAWAALKSHWSDLEKRAPMAVMRITMSMNNFCDPQSRADVDAFYSAHPMRGGAARAGKRVMEAIDTCIAFKSAQQASFDKALK
jgi:aminopeptidase N